MSVSFDMADELRKLAKAFPDWSERNMLLLDAADTISVQRVAVQRVQAENAKMREVVEDERGENAKLRELARIGELTASHCADISRRYEELQAENAKLRESAPKDQFEEELWDVFKRGGAWVAKSEYDRLRAENAKLCELVIRCKDCRYYDGIIHSCLRMDTIAGKQVSYVFDEDFCCWAKRKGDA